MIKEEGAAALYKGITPRIMRVAPGQAVTFTVYEFVKELLTKDSVSLTGNNEQKKLN